MTVTDHIQILDKRTMQNEAQYDIDRKGAKISALSSNNLNKYEYLTGEDLNLKQSTVEQARFEYSPLVKLFNKGLKEEDKWEGRLKRLKNIEDKNEDQKGVQAKVISKSKVKSPLLKSIYSQEVKDERIDGRW